MSVDLEFLRELCLCPSPSGFEGTVQAVLRRRLDGVAETHGDPLGNLWAGAGPEAGPQVIAVAHADQIGMIVTHVDEAGFLRLDAVGWLDQQLLPGHTVLVHGADGPVRGVVGRLPTHIVPEAERGKAAPIREQFVDIGAHDRAEALARVAVGDPVTFDQGFHELAPGRFASLAIDNRTGVYAVVRGLELYAAAGGKARLTAVSSAHEETTYMGAKALGRRLHPECVIVVDGTFSSDYPGVDAVRLSGEVKLGDGPVFGVGSIANRKLTALAREVASEEGIAVQTNAYAGEMMTDATELAAAGEAALLALSIPMRYVHSAAEVADASDIEATAELIAALTRRLGEVFEPGMFVP
jgi:putative aminopeptidase FrvX